jgi:hypothetical protein
MWYVWYFLGNIFYSVTVQVVILARRRHAPQCDTCWWYKKNLVTRVVDCIQEKENCCYSNWWQYVSHLPRICSIVCKKTWWHLASFVSTKLNIPYCVETNNRIWNVWRNNETKFIILEDDNNLQNCNRHIGAEFRCN